MTAKQDALYWREWGAVSRHCKAAAQPVPDRHELHVRALGADKSHKAFTNADLDKVLGVFRAISNPDSIGRQLRQIDQPRARKLAKIAEIKRCLALYITDPDGYVLSVIEDKFTGVLHIADLSNNPPHPDRPSQLDQLIMTLEARLNGAEGFRAAAGDSVHDMRTAARLRCTCSKCTSRPVTKPKAASKPVLVDEPF